MVLHLKVWESRSLPGLLNAKTNDDLLLSSNCLRSLLYQTSKSPLEPHRSGGVFVCGEPYSWGEGSPEGFECELATIMSMFLLRELDSQVDHRGRSAAPQV